MSRKALEGDVVKIRKKEIERTRRQRQALRRAPLILQECAVYGIQAKRLGREREARIASERLEELREIRRGDRRRGVL